MQQGEGRNHKHETSSRLPIVGVMGSGTEPHRDRADALGLWLATQDVHLLTGGGGGVMEAVCRAFHSVNERTGKIVGILPGAVENGRYRPMAGYPNPWIEIPIHTHLPLSGLQGTEPASRNHINILTATVIVALPGSHGTASEVRLALQYQKPLVAFLSAREDIPDLPREVYIEPVFEKVKSFVRSHIGGPNRSDDTAIRQTE